MNNITLKQKQRLRQLINALSINKYKQGVLALYNSNTTEWCWGGVAIDIYFENTHQGYWEAKDDSIYGVAHFTQESRTAYVHVPVEVLKWYGLDLEESMTLTDMNDTESTFKQIADVLSRKLKK